MLKLSTLLNLKTIQSNKKLQEIECDYCRCTQYDDDKPVHKNNCKFTEYPKGNYNLNNCGYSFPAPTIADIINNAEMLFGHNNVCLCCGEKWEEKFKYCTSCGDIREPKIGYFTFQNRILKMCQQDKPLQEIERYILESIKE